MTVYATGTLAGVVGWPVRHSLSPRLHGYWLREYGIGGAYLPLPVLRENLSSVLAALQCAGFKGVNVTVPHKEAAFALADEMDDDARASGAVNLLVFENGRLIGRNTDAAGLKASLVESLGGDCVRGSTAVVLGAGGAARAAVLACDALGAGRINILNRNRDRALAVAAAIRTRAVLQTYAWTEWPQAAADAGLLINATTGGMKDADVLTLSLDVLPRRAAVCDLVYNPLETELLKTARGRGQRTADGLGMLMHQAVPAFEAFYGVHAQVTDSLRKELEGALRGER